MQNKGGVFVSIVAKDVFRDIQFVSRAIRLNIFHTLRLHSGGKVQSLVNLHIKNKLLLYEQSHVKPVIFIFYPRRILAINKLILYINP